MKTLAIVVASLLTGFAVASHRSSIQAGTELAHDSTLRAQTIELIDQDGVVRWRLDGRNQSSGSPQISGFGAGGKERLRIALSPLDYGPSIHYFDAVTGKPMVMLDLDSRSGLGSLKLPAPHGTAVCAELAVSKVSEDLSEGIVRLLRSDGLPVGGR